MVTTRPKKTVGGQCPKTDIFLRIHELKNEKKQRENANNISLRTTATTSTTVQTEQKSNPTIKHTTKASTQLPHTKPTTREDTLEHPGTILTLDEFSRHY